MLSRFAVIAGSTCCKIGECPRNALLATEASSDIRETSGAARGTVRCLCDVVEGPQCTSRAVRQTRDIGESTSLASSTIQKSKTRPFLSQRTILAKRLTKVWCLLTNFAKRAVQETAGVREASRQAGVALRLRFEEVGAPGSAVRAREVPPAIDEVTKLKALVREADRWLVGGHKHRVLRRVGARHLAAGCDRRRSSAGLDGERAVSQVWVLEDAKLPLRASVRR